MKKTFTLISMFVFFFSLAKSFAGNENSNGKQLVRCGQEQYEQYMRSQNPNYDAMREAMEKSIQEGVEKMMAARIKGENVFTTYTIPIVFHVVYNTAAQNVSDTQIGYALTQLNQDWSRTNSDTNNTPAVWKSIAANMQIQFCLANKDPNGNATNGIIHKQTSTTSFPNADNTIKASSSGGDDPWNTSKYLNIWIGYLSSGGLLGYGAFPPINSTYGTVVDYSTIGSLTHPNSAGGQYGYGRTLSHEIGHCFNLYHIWGNVSSGCSNNSDSVTDTPSMDGPTSGCPSGVVTTPGCPAGSDGSPASNVSPGRMYQNIMDYTDDQCYNMFTNGQKARCQTCIAQYLSTVANSAATVCSATGIAENIFNDNITLYPNPSTGDVFISTNYSALDVKVFNAIGEAVMTKRINIQGESKINLSNNPDGIYLFEMKTPEGITTKKVILNR